MNDREQATCCSGETGELELDTLHDNRPGLPALAYRVGRHGDFLARMLARLPGQRAGTGDGGTPLGRLTYRGKDDPTIAVLDACSSMLDVLSFYQERIANEGFLRVAQERRSVLELVRSIGYEMRPGLAASSLLAFTVEDAPGVPEQVTVPRGTQVMSIPKKGELPQIFETVDEIEARAVWNELTVRAPWTTMKQVVDTSTTMLFVAGTGTGVRPGEVLLLVDGANDKVRYLRRVQDVRGFPERGYTRIELQPPADAPADPVVLAAPHLFAFRQRARLFGHDAARGGLPFEVRRVFVAGIQTPVQCVALAPQGDLALSGFEAVSPLPDPIDDQHPGVYENLYTTLRLWRVDDPRDTHAFEIYHTVTAAAFSPGGQYVAAADHAGGQVHVNVWHAASGAHVVKGRFDSQGSVSQSGPIVALVFQYDAAAGTGDITTVGQDGQAVIWRLVVAADPAQVSTLTPMQSLDLSVLGDFASDPTQARDGDRSLVGNKDGTTVYTAKELPAAIPEDVVLAYGDVDLAGQHTGLVPQSWTLLVEPERTEAFWVRDVTLAQRDDYGLSARVTRLRVDLEDGTAPAFSMRETDVYAGSEELALADVPVALPEPVGGDLITLAEPVADLAGRTVIVEGRIASAPDTGAAAPARITALVSGDRTVALDVLDASEAGQPARFRDDNGFVLVVDDDRDFDLVTWRDEGEVVREVARVEPREVAADETVTSTEVSALRLVAPLQNTYDWRSVRILANVAPATHGETADQVLGSGDGLQRNQRFALRKPPLSYVPAAGAGGSQSTLEVRVNGVLWKEIDSLYMAGPTDEVYMVRIQDDGKTEVIFGDGQRGARLPSGVENVVARYRSGLGPVGEVDAGQLALLKTRPAGIRAVGNPLSASGAASPEQKSEARENAPRTSLVLGRVVSIQDYEDFTRSYPGTGKAQAVAMWNGVAKFVHLTVGTASGAPMTPGSVLHQSLVGALDTVRDTTQIMAIEGYTARTFGVMARVLIDERYLPEPVLARIRARLIADFSYQAREFGQDVSAAEIVAAMHRVEGVVAVDLDELFYAEDTPKRDEQPDFGEDAPTQRLEAQPAELLDGKPRPAELLLIDPNLIDVKDRNAPETLAKETK